MRLLQVWETDNVTVSLLEAAERLAKYREQDVFSVSRVSLCVSLQTLEVWWQYDWKRWIYYKKKLLKHGIGFQ